MANRVFTFLGQLILAWMILGAILSAIGAVPGIHEKVHGNPCGPGYSRTHVGLGDYMSDASCEKSDK